MTTAVFLRHGPTQENNEDRIQGHQHGHLLMRQTEQYLAAVIPLLRPLRPTVLLSSDLGRAVETRTILSIFLQATPVTTPELALLRERTLGSLEGKCWHELPPALASQRDNSTYDFRPFGGENDADVLMRVKATLHYLSQHYPDQTTIACITHGGWIQQLIRLAGQSGVLPDGWSNRTALYKSTITNDGHLSAFSPILIKAKLPLDS